MPVHYNIKKKKEQYVRQADLRVEEVFEEPSTKHRHSALRKPPLRPPDVVRLAKSSHGACPLDRSGCTACETEQGDIFAQPHPGSNLRRIAQLALYHAFHALEMFRHGTESHGRERGGIAEPGDRLERGHHSLDLLVILPVPLADLRKSS
jgi:hypothetical protein